MLAIRTYRRVDQEAKDPFDEYLIGQVNENIFDCVANVVNIDIFSSDSFRSGVSLRSESRSKVSNTGETDKF